MLIGKKLGMTRIFSEEGKSLPVTVIKASPCFVIDRRTEERDGYTAYVMGFGKKKEKRVKKPVLGLCKKAGVPPVEVIREFRAKDTSAFEIGEEIPVSVLQKGDKIDVVGWSKGRGFQGVVKRWGFSGGPGSHGSRFGRAPGSAGAGTYPGRVLKGKKFPGRMGNDRVTVRNLEIVSLDEENGLILVKGAVPGFRNGLLLIKISSDVDVSARKELTKEKAKKDKEKQEKKAQEAVVEKKAEAKIDKNEKKAKKTEDKDKRAKKKEEKAEQKSEEKKDKKAKDKGKGKKAKAKEKEKTEKKAESKEIKREAEADKKENGEEKKAAKEDKKVRDEAKKEKSEGEANVAKKAGDEQEKENKSEKRGDS
jgi:large subunit ribosomal protein L3